MKIIDEGPTTLVAKSRPWAQAAIGFVFLFIAAQLYLLPYLFPEESIAQSSQGNIPIVFPFIFAGIGIMSILTFKFFTIRLDKSTQQGTITIWRLIGRRSKSFSLNQIKELRREKIIGYARRMRPTSGRFGVSPITTRVDFVLTDGRQFDSMITGRKPRVNEIGARMAHFLDVPFTDSRPPTAREMLGMVRGETTIEAIERKRQSQNKSGGGAPPPLVR